MFKNLFKKKETYKIYGYLEGEIVQLENVPDPVFSKKMMGEGIAIQPTKGDVYSPLAGEVVFVADTHHAIGIKTEEGLEVLLHLGLETVSIKDNGLSTLVKAGDKVEAHQKIASISEKALSNDKVNMISMLVFTNLADFEIKSFANGQTNHEQIILELGKAK